MASFSAAWISSFTGLPSFTVSGAGRLVTSDGREVASSTRSVWRVSDPLAPVGVPVKYSLGGSATRTLTRAPFGGPGTALISDVGGRGVVVDFYENIREPLTFRTGGSRYANGRVRSDPRGDVWTGDAKVVLDTAEKVRELTLLLSAPGRKLIAIDSPAEGVRPVRAVWVTDFDRLRTSTEGAFEFYLMFEYQPDPVGGGPVATFGEVAATGLLWGTNVLFGDVMSFGGGL